MHASAYNDRVECMELLEQHEGNVNAVDDDGYTPLMIAAERGHDRAMGMFPDIYNRGKNYWLLLQEITVFIAVFKANNFAWSDLFHCTHGWTKTINNKFYANKFASGKSA